VMSLRKSPILTPARLLANRRNALKSTGPRTARGKAWSRLNGLRTGSRSPTYMKLLRALVDAEPGGIEQAARVVLTPQQAAHPLFARTVESFRKIELEICQDFRRGRLELESRRKKEARKVTVEP
jgi:hypothetical protein